MNKKVVMEWVKTIGYPIIIAFLITLIIRPIIVQEHSMYSTVNENDYIIVNKWAYVFGEPSYRDIIAFKSDLKRENGKNKYLIKRIIAVPGDEITITDGKVILNGETLQEDYISGSYTSGEVDALIIPEGKLFVMGDNRAHSMDSRDERVGLVDESSIMGKTLIRLFPFNKIGTIR